MRILNLAENTKGSTGCDCEHGLCFYVETDRHHLLMDTGASALFLENADRLGVDLGTVDTVVLSHGHYDHGGGIPAFAARNPSAPIYLQSSAFGDHCSLKEDGSLRYIGLDPAIRDLPQVIRADQEAQDGDAYLVLDEELVLFWGIGRDLPVPSANRNLKIRRPGGQGEAAEALQDDFRHEQCLVIRQAGKTILMSGCAHHGILNILARYRQLAEAGILPGPAPDLVISGFHMMQKQGFSQEDIDNIIDTARTLKKDYSHTHFYTCHCTGEPAYEAMQAIMGSQLKYVHCGDEIR